MKNKPAQYKAVNLAVGSRDSVLPLYLYVLVKPRIQVDCIATAEVRKHFFQTPTCVSGHLGGETKLIIDRTLSRVEQVFQNIDQRSMVGLEIGALDNPIARPAAGQVFYADYCSTADLRRNHVNTPTVDINSIVDVDFVTNGGYLRDVVPDSLKFDYVIASHVIEHVPDIISWLQDIGHVLKPGGILSLIVPNKEHTFDSRRSISEQKDFFAANILRQTKPSPIQVFDYYRWHERNGSLVHTLEYSIEMARKSISDYVDAHCWVFTTETFYDEIQTLIDENLIPYNLGVVTKTPPGEIDMFAQLVRT